MSDLEVLRKALDKFPEISYSKDDSKNLNVLVKVMEWKIGFLPLFSVFQQAHDKQVHVSRKQLSEDLAFAENVLKHKSYAGVDGKRYWQGRKSQLKELLEAGLLSVERPPLEKETKK